MNRLLLLLFLTLSLNSFSQTQSEMNVEAAESFKNAEKDLASTVKAITHKYKSDPVFIENLNTAQKLWIKLREAELELKYPIREKGFYGSVLPMCKALFLTKLTELRTEKLKEYVNNSEEGDVCN